MSTISPNTNKKYTNSQKGEDYEQSSQIFPTKFRPMRSQPIQLIFNQFQSTDPIQNLQKLKQTIHGKMKQLDHLNGQFFDKQQKMFFKTFINMMDRMSNELLEAKQKYNNIDQQIDRETQCVQLRSKLSFYKDECLFLKDQLENAQNTLKQLKYKNYNKELSNKQLQARLKKQATKQVKYKQRKHSLSVKLSNFDMQKLGLNKQSKDSLRNKSVSTKSGLNHDGLCADEKRFLVNKIKRPMTAIIIQKKQHMTSPTFEKNTIKTTQNYFRNTKQVKEYRFDKSFDGLNHLYSNLTCRKQSIIQRIRNN